MARPRPLRTPRNGKTRSSRPALAPDPVWYRSAIFYELHVRAFHDSNGDGIGDFRGLVQKLDYLQDLGVDTLWLLPFYPSPLRDDGYDIADYTDVHPDYGTLHDFKLFLREAHARGLRVVTELVLNHTSDQHPWFQRARRAPAGSAWRDYYVWSDSPDRYRGTRIIFQDFEPSNWSWDPVAQAYFWHRFYSHQPDLNFESPAVRRALLQAVDFWFNLGVDGLRLDAVPYLYEREGTNCENLPETHAFLKQLRRHVDREFRDRMLLAEANMWPEDAVAYFGDGDECHMSFHFPLMPRLFMAVRMEDRYPVYDILQQTPSIPEPCQWGLFLRNHDELTLEMVTDEDRDYMYRVYAEDPQARINLGIRRRLGPLLGNDRRRIELMNGLLFSLPGTPILYYGDEIGMGDNVWLGDRNGVRTPMQWSADRNAGFSRANPQRLYLPVIIDSEYHHQAVNVEAQQHNRHSMLWWVKRLIGLRKQYRAFGQGSLEFLLPENRKVLAFVRRFDDERILVLVNLSRFTQCAEVDLTDYEGMVPVELFGRQDFPAVGAAPYFFTLSPHAFYWFALERRGAEPVETTTTRELRVARSWTELLEGDATGLERVLPAYLASCRWFGAKSRRPASTQIAGDVPLTREPGGPRLTYVRLEYTEGEPELYQLPLAEARGEAADRIERERPEAVVARVRATEAPEVEAPGVLYDPSGEREFSEALFDAIVRRRRLRGRGFEVSGTTTRALRDLWNRADGVPEPAPLRAEQSNTSVLYANRFVLKLFRKVDAGMNPDLEIGRFLTERTDFTHTPPVAGALEGTEDGGPDLTFAFLQGFVESEADAWKYTLDSLGRYFERCLARSRPPGSAPDTPAAVPDPAGAAEASDVATAARDLVGVYLGSAARLGTRTAELHLGLASDSDDPAFRPEPFPPHFRRSVQQSIRSQLRESLQLLRKRTRVLAPEARDEARGLVDREDELERMLRSLLRHDFDALRIRCHGDYHLGQVLFTGKDFVILDFEGEPARPIGERRIKRSPLVDVAGMLRSFDYATVHALMLGGGLRPEDQGTLEPWAAEWRRLVTEAFLSAYAERMAGSRLVPAEPEPFRALLGLYLLEKAVYEIRYELNHRPDWVRVPVRGLLRMLDETGAAPGRT